VRRVVARGGRHSRPESWPPLGAPTAPTIIRLPTSFCTDAAAGSSPRSSVFREMPPRKGATAALASAGPARAHTSCPLRAASGRPNTGHATRDTPAAAARLLASVVGLGVHRGHGHEAGARPAVGAVLVSEYGGGWRRRRACRRQCGTCARPQPPRQQQTARAQASALRSQGTGARELLTATPSSELCLGRGAEGAT